MNQPLACCDGGRAAARAKVLHSDEPAKGLELLTSASPSERANLEAVLLRGIAYLRNAYQDDPQA